ncbi:hypothetical protein CfE428DRAFT_5077 [Chthoniobacter flavus Ellin428]|uniref:PEP-CTERM protein-sorting domain-containing protein n=1 Tax=Chthoniobacter flavus Ellin428 TaxID=497964 RepID=B4D837_9BACT|nr:PEP-CTERM sorting domain-containing protein [Chthoniobacter flavus]EDY17391.1 hypothetical protein CfE428DRAFT_5077 [Chthoniobacter flavus Ellin428]TCO87360.1 putative secreted protein with PEP-CTERM sorting signal [Chthoniobacter flavus]
MRRILLSSLFALFAACASSYGTIVVFSASPSARNVLDSSLNALPANDLVLVGMFSNVTNPTSAPFTFNASESIAQNFSAISAAGGWTQFGSSGLAITSSPADKIGGTVTDDTAAANPFNGQMLYVWVFNASSVSAATEMGIFTATSANEPWVFPVNAGPNNNTTYSTTPSATTTMVAVGNTGAVQPSGTGNMVLSAASPAPEPSTVVSLIGATGFLAMLRRRRAVHS